MRKNLKLKMALFEEGIAQRQLANMVGIPEAYISLAINGKFELNNDQQRPIAIALGRSQSDIFGG